MGVDRRLNHLRMAAGRCGKEAEPQRLKEKAGTFLHRNAFAVPVIDLYLCAFASLRLCAFALKNWSRCFCRTVFQKEKPLSLRGGSGFFSGAKGGE
ncbi:hypothetical protein KP003_16505 [Geomonas nitrogeniifigens]|uniref:hypothetical protein n=1 Tax=Geomonas diazotrophica TaxID=2843197 RepID=UPI001C2C3D98|nr:hypothetical protein [Geomonas nitrogeniifigens]QXE85943.1 hypothetical protein KP003_16505 [Geomonas nitrogeniifigens]